MARTILYRKTRQLEAPKLPNDGHEILASLQTLVAEHISAAEERQSAITARLAALEAESAACSQVKALVK